MICSVVELFTVLVSFTPAVSPAEVEPIWEVLFLDGEYVVRFLNPRLSTQ